MTPASGGGTRSTGGGDDGLDALFDAMAHPHRRFLLSRLLAGDGPLTVRQVAADVATWDGSGDERPPPDARTVAAGFHHVHLPKLTDAGLVAYDAEAGTISRGRRAARVERFLPES